MQYKIPVQIENEDPILLGLSIRQLAIIMLGGGIAFSLFKSLAPNVGKEIAAIPSIIITIITLLIALFKQYEMTFIPFMLSILRFNINLKERVWRSGVDSIQPIDIGYITTGEDKEEVIHFKNKMEEIDDLEEKLKKL